MTRVNEYETPGVSDSLPKAVKPLANSRKNPSTKQVLAKIPTPDDHFQPLQIPNKVTQSKVEGKTLSIEYFQLFLGPEWLDTLAEWTNNNTNQKRKDRKDEFMEIYPDPEDHTQRNWVYNTWGEEIGIFIGSQLLMGVDRKGEVPLNWAHYTDVLGNNNISNVNKYTFFEVTN